MTRIINILKMKLVYKHNTRIINCFYPILYFKYFSISNRRTRHIVVDSVIVGRSENPSIPGFRA